jgi:hypothetical protein
MADKKKNISLDLQSLRKISDKFLYPVRAHSTFLLVMISLGLIAYSVIIISGTIQQTDDPTYREEQSANRIKSTFDKETIKKIDNLRNSNDSSSIDLPDGRRNPFIN